MEVNKDPELSSPSFGAKEETSVRNSQTKRLYQVWKGNNRFLCDGRLVFGPDVKSLLLTFILIAGPATAFCVKMYINTKDGSFSWFSVWVIGVILTVLDIILLFLTSSRDPGIVPRNLQPIESDETFDLTTPSLEWVASRKPHLQLPRVKDVIVNGHTVRVKYCETCLLYRPPCAYHCSICNNCVHRFDHHCPWVGHCIGMRNYRYFFMFISTTTILCIYVFAFCWVSILSYDRTLWKAMADEVLEDILLVYCFIIMWFIGGLTVFHAYLICTNQTTYENFRYGYDKKENPYSKGMILNVKEILFSKTPPRLNNFRSMVKEDEYMVSEAPNPGEHVDSSHKENNIEMRTKFVEGSGPELPEILKTSENGGMEIDVLTNNATGKSAHDSVVPVNTEGQESLMSFSNEDNLKPVGSSDLKHTRRKSEEIREVEPLKYRSARSQTEIVEETDDERKSTYDK